MGNHKPPKRVSSTQQIFGLTHEQVFVREVNCGRSTRWGRKRRISVAFWKTPSESTIAVGLIGQQQYSLECPNHRSLLTRKLASSKRRQPLHEQNRPVSTTPERSDRKRRNLQLVFTPCVKTTISMSCVIRGTGPETLSCLGVVAKNLLLPFREKGERSNLRIPFNPGRAVACVSQR